MIPIFNTYIHEGATKIVADVLGSTFISEGKMVKEFEKKLNAEFGLLNPVALNSGTSALHLALVLAGVGENDEVILPAQTFVASGLVILQQKAKPVFADINYTTGNICTEDIERKITSKTKAIMPVHWGGYPCEMDKIQKLATKYNLKIIEDAAHALGAKYEGKNIGTLSDFTCFSFQAIKHLTTGDGGAISCKSEEDFNQAMTTRWFGINRGASTLSELGERNYNISQLGFKYHLNDYAAALGLANMEKFQDRLAKRKEYAGLYDNELINVKGIQLFSYSKNNESAYWLYGFHVENRIDFIRALKDRGITASVIHQRIDRNSVFGGLNQDLENQAKFDESQVHIPIHDALDFEKINHIIHSIKKGW